MDDWEKLLAESQTPEGRAKTRALIYEHGGVVYSSDPKYPGEIIEVSIDGTRRRGRFVNRRFVPME